MSYILDALKRADAERERGHVPGLHTLSPSAGLPPAAARRSRRLGLWVGTSAAVLAGSLATGWFWLRQGTAEPLAQPMPATASVSPPTTTARSADIPLPPPSVAAAEPRHAQQPPEPPPARRDGLRTPEATPAIKPKAGGLLPPAAPPTSPRTAAEHVPAPALPTRAAAALASGPAPDNVAELTPELRSQLPPLQVTGAVYSNNPGQRLLLVNGLVLPQGSSVAPDLSIEDIGPHSSVLRFRGQRLRIHH